MLVPGLTYDFETFVECLNDKGITDSVKVRSVLPVPKKTLVWKGLTLSEPSPCTISVVTLQILFA